MPIAHLDARRVGLGHVCPGPAHESPPGWVHVRVGRVRRAAHAQQTVGKSAVPQRPDGRGNEDGNAGVDSLRVGRARTSAGSKPAVG